MTKMMSEFSSEMVSVVIPTLNRPQLVSTAVKSALSQTFGSIEVIVVVDGPDRATVSELAQIVDPRLRVIELPTNLGASGARNAGIEAAQGTWIAFLDDDDQWLPLKLERQLAVAHQSIHAKPIVSSRFFAHTAKGEFIWPRRLPAPSESMGDYLFVRNSLFLGETFVVTPTILVKKELLEQIPFDRALPRHEDWDWLIRVSALEGVGLEFVPDPMAVVNIVTNQKRQSLSNINDWQYSLDWIRSVRHLVTPTAYSACVTTVVSSQAAIDRDWPAFMSLLREAFKFGKPRPIDLFLYVFMWLIPQELRQQLRSVLAQKNPDPAQKVDQSNSVKT
jgi:glycosyltransferase involved in cell wall biosynthesis